MLDITLKRKWLETSKDNKENFTDIEENQKVSNYLFLTKEMLYKIKWHYNAMIKTDIQHLIDIIDIKTQD